MKEENIYKEIEMMILLEEGQAIDLTPIYLRLLKISKQDKY